MKNTKSAWFIWIYLCAVRQRTSERKTPYNAVSLRENLCHIGMFTSASEVHVVGFHITSTSPKRMGKPSKCFLYKHSKTTIRQLIRNRVFKKSQQSFPICENFLGFNEPGTLVGIFMDKGIQAAFPPKLFCNPNVRPNIPPVQHCVSYSPRLCHRCHYIWFAYRLLHLIFYMEGLMR